jgi:VWFA-related protein
MQYRGIWWAGILLAAGAAAQTPPASAPVQTATPTTIRTETKLVLVDAVVTDKKGNYIHDLTQKDFKVLEDEKQQNVKTFSFGADPMAPNDSRRRYMVLFFDLASMEPGDQIRARQEAAKFIDGFAGPDKLVAVVNFGGSLQTVANFTDDVERLKQAVTGVRMSSVTTVASAGRMRGLGGMADFGARSVLLALRSLARNLSEVPGRKSLVMFSAGFPLTIENRPEVTAAIEACNKANIAIYPVDVRGLVVMPFASPRGALMPPQPPAQAPAMLPFVMRDVQMALAADPILRIAAFWFQRGGTSGGGTSSGGTSSGGTSSGGTSSGAGAAGGGAAGGGGGGLSGSGMGGRGGGSTSGGGEGGMGGGSMGGRGFGGAGASGAGSMSGGTRGGPGTGGGGGTDTFNRQQIPRESPLGQRNVIVPPFPPSATTNQQVLYMLAEGTGGFVIANSNDMLGGLDKIGKEQNQYYILGYTPPETQEGSCHKITVKMNRGGLNVRARTGYCNSRVANVLAGKPIEKELETRALASAAGTVAAIMQAPFFYTSPDTARVNLAIEIPSKDIKFEKVKGKQHAEVNVLGMVYRKNGELAAKFGDTAKVDFEDKKDVEKFGQKPYHYENQFDVASGEYNLKVVFSSGGESFGKLDLPLTIEPYDGKQFTMSGLALSTEFHNLAELGAQVDIDLLEGKQPLTARNIAFTPTGSNRFRKTDKVAIYVELYDPLLTEDNPPRLGFQLRVLDSAGAQKMDSGVNEVAQFIRKGSPVVPVGLRLPTDNLTAGVYKLELKAMDTAGRTFVRTADFEVQ